MVPKNVSATAVAPFPVCKSGVQTHHPGIFIDSLTTNMTAIRFAFLALFWLLGSVAVSAQHGDHARPDVEVGDKAPLLDGLGNLQHSVSTTNADAQRYFNQGLILLYGFNHVEAERSFKHAARLDPNLAMAYWGQAFALGANINDPITDDREAQAQAAINKAIELKPNASEKERAYIDALAARYSNEPDKDRKPLDRAYADAMEQVAQKFPEDPDAAVLYADALMNTMPWDYYLPGGEPKPDTRKLLSTLETVIEKFPRHPGADHLYIHAVETAHPDKAVASADRLLTYAPAAGHLVHMPSHIYILVGRYADASRSNELAIKADQSYITQCRVQGFYPVSYYPHNWHFLAMASMMEGRSAVALNAARETAAATPADLSGVPVWGNPFPAVPLFAMARFGKWDDILAYPKPAMSLRYSRGIWHYARGLAWARRRKFTEAETALNSLSVLRQDPELQEYIAGANSAARQLEISENVLRGELAAERKDYATAISSLRKAVSLQDSLTYNEPEDWYYPVRHSLGAVLLAAGRPEQAELVYREDLKQHPENGWALYGLTASLKTQRKSAEAADAQRRFEQAWARADVKLNASRF